MEALEKNQIDIDRYLLGQMDEQEAVEFGQRVAADAVLSEQLADTRLVSEIVNAAEDQNLLQRLQNLEGQLALKDSPLRVVEPSPAPAGPEATVKELSPWRRYLSVAATVLLVLAAAWFLLRPSALSNQDLFAENFVPYPNSEVLDRGSAEERQMAYFAYQSGDYARAYELLSGLPDEPGNRFFTAQAALASGRAEIARDLLSPLAENSDFVLREEAEWQLALAHLELDDREAAQTILRDISRDNRHDRQREATVLLTKF